MTASLRVPGYHGPRVLTGLTLHGYEAVILENELVRVLINVGRGTHIPEFTYKPKDLDVLFKHPRPHKHHASYIPTAYDERPYYDHHAGGWFECFPNGGPPQDLEGARIGFHGEVWGQPFRIDAVEENPERCALTVTGFTQRTPFQLTKTFSLRANDAALRIDEQVTNLGEQDLKVLWGQHPTLGGPLLDEGSFLECSATSYFLGEEDPPVRRKWPAQDNGRDLSRTLTKEARTSRFYYLTDFAEGKARLVSPKWKLAFEIEFDAARFPYLWFFENAGALGAPWFGRAHMAALEPFSGMSSALKEGHGLIKIPAGKSVEATFTGRFVEV
ncbi:MAG: DUF4432 family protein [Planctomycetes bacterium]|nr:DUF4432 family protein [Planctomycetota bacterium]